MTHDEWLTLALVGTFAAFVTAHGLLVAGLLRRGPVWRALVAAVALPLAPVWGLRARMPIRACLWIASALAYAATRWLARP
jgi:hypothetical protein